MTNKTSNSFEGNIDFIRQLADVLGETGLSEIEIEHNNIKIRVVKTLASTTVPYIPPPAIEKGPAVSSNAPVPDVNVCAENHPGAIKSPMVGTAYFAASPGAAPFVQIGTMVTQGQTLLIIEAMKTMNEIKAPRAGKVTQIIAQDSEPVEFGEPLLIIE